MHNWARDGVLKPAYPGIFDRDAVLAAEKLMKARRGRPAAAETRMIEVAPGTWIEVTHLAALDAGPVALICGRWRVEPAQAPPASSKTDLLTRSLFDGAAQLAPDSLRP